MPAITISMDIELMAEIERVAKERGLPVSVFMQQASRKYLDQLKKQTPRSSKEKRDQQERDVS